MSMKQAGGNRRPGAGGGSGAAAASGAGGSAAAGGRQSLGRGRNNAKGATTAVSFNGVYANMRMVHVLTSVVGTKCELKVRNGMVYEGVFKTYGPECEMVLDAAHRSSELSGGPPREDIVESIIFKSSDVVVVHFRDVDLNYAKKVSSETDNFTDSAVSARVNGEHKEKDLEPWDGGESHPSDSLESLDTDMSNGWDPDDMFKYNEETYGVKSTYDSSLSSYTVPLERDNSEEFLKREARAAQLADEIESSASYKARVALENDDRSEEEKYTAVVRGERESHTLNREKYIPPGQRNLSWGAGRQNSPRLSQCSPGPHNPRSSPHDYSGAPADQRVVNGGSHPWPSHCQSPSSRPPSRYQPSPSALASCSSSSPSSSSLPPRAATPTRPPSRPPSRPSRPPSHPSSASVSTVPKRMSSEGPPRMSPKSQRTPRPHRAPACRSGPPPGVDFMSHNASGEAPAPLPARSSPSGGTWSSVVSGAHRPRSPRQNSLGGASPGSSSLPSPQAGIAPIDSVTVPMSSASPIAASPASNLAATPSAEAKDPRVQEGRQSSPITNKDNIKPLDSSGIRPVNKGAPGMPPDHRKQIDNLKKFSVDFRLQWAWSVLAEFLLTVFMLQSSTNPDPLFESMVPKQVRDAGEKPKELPADKSLTDLTGPKPGPEPSTSEEASATPVAMTAAPVLNTGKSGTPSPSLSSASTSSEHKRGPDVLSQGVQTSTPTASGAVAKQDDKEERKDAVPDRHVRKSTLNPNAKEFNPRAFTTPPKPATTPTLTRPQGQPSPSIMVQQPPAVYGQTVCFSQMYPLTPVSPGVQPPAMYHVQVPHMTVSQNKPYRPVPSMPQQRPEQHHPPGTSTMIHPATAAGPPIVAPSPAYSAQYFACSPQQFTSQPLVQQMTPYQSQAQHVFSPVMQGGPRMITPPTHGQHTLVSSSTTQYGEQATMYVSAPLPQQYPPHPSTTLHPHAHPQPSATPTGQTQQGAPHGPAHGPAPSPVQHPPHQPPQPLHLAGSPQQQMYSALAHTPPSMTPGPNTQSPQTSFASAQQAVYLHPQHGYNPSHMAHVQQAHMQSGMVPSHHATPSHPPMMLMATQPPAGPQNTLNPIPVSSTTHFSYMAHAPVQPHHQQQL
ncbi:ataxin-2 isoform X3 [Denticeps clupeoides]|uniref:ataxin-2 isoform X3 n=1 Tax=Denticeps clupeoides TaxID=299321 RepID=UPI0010A58C6F|nr:ataxin-2 isoform X3 [Denticeps clupeoides]